MNTAAIAVEERAIEQVEHDREHPEADPSYGHRLAVALTRYERTVGGDRA